MEDVGGSVLFRDRTDLLAHDDAGLISQFIAQGNYFRALHGAGLSVPEGIQEEPGVAGASLCSYYASALSTRASQRKLTDRSGIYQSSLSRTMPAKGSSSSVCCSDIESSHKLWLSFEARS
ncbi:hypothetical protein ATANTOWER_022834 [Ataeniobius toweri]|uniref:Uncharacterized protein n=1 Tax=Ataeniobius toweri TaxID=208326 RepID=A0ABU7A814_9TELE|nr:hypothetical protein [Ataeniobius toweri]